MTELPLSKTIDIEDFSAPELIPYLREINEEEAIRFGSSADEIVVDSKQWECACALRALDAAQAASPGSWVAGVGAGIEGTIFALARRGCLVFPVDRYLHRTVWSDVAPAGMMVDPARFSQLPFPRGHVIPVHSNALRLNLPDGRFDGVFSSGSIEHFGSLDNVAEAAREIGRILKPGGVASIATEFRLEGPADRAWFDDNVILFTPELLDRYIVRPSGLSLRAPVRFEQSARTFESRQNLVDFLQRAQNIHTIEEKRAAYPNLVLYHDGFLFCSIVLTLYKDEGASSASSASRSGDAVGADPVDGTVNRENAELAAELERFQRSPAAAPPAPQIQIGDLQRLQTENDRLQQDLARANAWKHWTIMRPVRFVYRRLKRWRG